MGIFTLMLGGLVGYALEQAKYGRALHAREEALSIAESGLEYFKWHVAHNTAIREDGTGLQSSYSYTVNDPEGGELGSANITTSAYKQCGRVQWIDVESEGTSNADTRFKRVLAARYVRPAVAEYAFVTDSGVYYVSNVTGPVHGNSGVRMDGTNNSIVSSKLGANEFWCTSSYNCSPSQWKNGVFGNAGHPHGRTDRASFDETANHFDPFCLAQLVHFKFLRFPSLKSIVGPLGIQSQELFWPSLKINSLTLCAHCGTVGHMKGKSPKKTEEKASDFSGARGNEEIVRRLTLHRFVFSQLFVF